MMFTLIILFLILRALNPWRWYRPYGGFFWGGPGLWRRPPMRGPHIGFGPGMGFGPGPGMRGPGGFGGPGHGAGRF